MQSDPGAPAFFKDIANTANVNERNEWHRAPITTPRLLGCSTCQLGSPCTTSTRPDHDPSAAHLVQDQGCRLQEGTMRPRGHRLQQACDFSHTFSPTVKYTTLRTVLAIAAEHDLDVRGGDVTQAYPQADWPTDQK
eukprot:6211762-Pleurochrysis_carterae.AAC.3